MVTEQHKMKNLILVYSFFSRLLPLLMGIIKGKKQSFWQFSKPNCFLAPSQIFWRRISTHILLKKPSLFAKEQIRFYVISKEIRSMHGTSSRSFTLAFEWGSVSREKISNVCTTVKSYCRSLRFWMTARCFCQPLQKCTEADFLFVLIILINEIISQRS